MKILHLGKFDGDIGGIERHLRALLGAMPDSVKVVNLVANQRPITDQHRDRDYLTVRAASHGTLASVALAPSMPALARALHREHRFDIVHLHFPDPLGQLVAMALPRSVRRVISWHSDVIKQRWALALYAPFQRSFVSDADALIGATPQHFSSSTQIPPVHGTQIREVIPYGFDPAPFASTSATRAKQVELASQRSARPLIFTLGRHVYYKGFDVLIRSLREVDADLWIGGRGPLTDSLRRIAQEFRVADHVRFLGFIPDHELVAYYDACDVFCLPSTERAEQFGLVQLEAMHCGKPVVATRLGTGVEYVTIDGSTGFLVAPNDPIELAAALRTLLADADMRQQFGEAGKRRVQEVFSVDQMVSRTLDVYRRVLNGVAR